MLDSARCFEVLHELGITFFAGVPDSLLKSFCAYVNDNVAEKDHLITANEGSAVALGVGYHLATGRIPLIYLQNSGLGNLINPLLSIADPDVYSIPMLLMIGWRGEPGVKDEPQHVKQGRVTRAMLESMEIPYSVIDAELDSRGPGLTAVLTQAVNQARSKRQPYALLVRKNSFAPYRPSGSSSSDHPLLREQALSILVEQLDPDDVVVSTTGVTSRELFELRDVHQQGHARDFLVVGGMGHTSQIALGLALQQPERQVYCFDGDGSFFMHMGSLATNGVRGPENFHHIVFNNGAHDSVGGQPTLGFEVDMLSIARASGYRMALSALTAQEIERMFRRLKAEEGPGFMEIRVNKGFRKNLGRPTTTPQQNKLELMANLGQ
ncbi:MAG: phosphonopyruvate decarboxylase [bacterium]|nr:phosphonopyruvate decarboxylase [bacterium]